MLSNDYKGDNPATVTTFDTTSTNDGTVIYNDDGTFTYTPATDFSGTDTFDYTITDNNGDKSTATVTVTVNALPQAVDDNTSTNVNTPVTTDNVLTNDDQGDIPATVISADTISDKGSSVVDQGDGTFIYVTTNQIKVYLSLPLFWAMTIKVMDLR